MTEDLHVTARRDGDLGLILAGGEVRLEIATQLREEGERLLKEGATNLVVGLQGVVFMDSASLAALIRLDQRAHQKGGKVVLFGLSPAVKRVLVNSGLEDRFAVAADEAAARALVAPGPAKT